MEGFLKRYTELPFLLYALKNKKLTLLNPKSWDDKNDAHYLLEYGSRLNCGSVLALCFTEAPETYHHWKVFSGSKSGVCIDFKLPEFREWVSTMGLKFGKVKYRKLIDAKRTAPQLSDLPFLKRIAFSDERELRLLYESQERGLLAKNFELDLRTISRVVLSPWLPPSVSEPVKDVIRGLDGCASIKVFRTSLIDNLEWKRLGAGNV